MNIILPSDHNCDKQNMTESTYNPIIQLEKVKKRIALACAQYNRKPEEVTLVGVSKTKPASQITQLHLLGLKSIGENYLNEATVKQEELKELDIDWHYIGKIQSNKTRIIANSFSWVHGVDRLKIAQRINQQSEQKNKINILLQINLDDEDSKSGVHLDSAKTLCEEVSKLENLHLRGFMAIPKPRDNFEQQLEC